MYNYSTGEHEYTQGQVNYIPTKGSVTFEVSALPPGEYEYRVTGGTVERALGLSPAPIVISGKTVSPYEAQYRVDLPRDMAPWDIRLRRVTPDHESSKYQDKTYFAAYTEIIDHKFTYPNSALIGIAVDAENFGGSIPTRSYEIYGIKVKVPDNYDPKTRAYTGVWLGTFKKAWSNNPAWVLYDILTNDRYGLGRYVNMSVVDKWSFYEIAKYCDEIVPDGFGGTEPRFTFNGVINTREDAYKVVQSIASAFRGMVYWASGAVYASQDRPKDVAQIVTAANVINGDFNYSGTGLKARHTVVKVTWNDPKDGFKPAIEWVEDKEGVARYGINETDVLAYGCTSRGQAARFGKWILESEKNETQTVTYRASLDHFTDKLAPGDVIAVADPAYAKERMGGRVVAATTSQITLDAPVALSSGETYSLYVQLPDGTVAYAGVSSEAGERTVVDLTAPLPVAPEVNAVWVMSGSDIEPRKFTVRAIRQESANVVEVTALLHDETKYARVEQGINLDPSPFVRFRTDAIDKPILLAVKEYLYKEGAGINIGVTFSWQRPDDARATLYKYQYASEGGGYTAAQTISAQTVDIKPITPGRYTFRVAAVNSIGAKQSQWSEIALEVLGKTAPPADVTDFRINNLGATAFLSWAAVSDLDLSHYTVRFSPLISGASWSASSSLVDKVNGTSVSVPSMKGTYFVKAVDGSGIESVNAALIISEYAVVEGMNAIETVEEAPTFSGVKTNCSVSGIHLVTSSQDFMDSWITLDSVKTLEYGVTGYPLSAEYYFSGVVDLGAIYTSRLTAAVDAEAENRFAVMDGWETLDSVVYLSGTSANEWSVTLQIRSTNDDPAVSPVWSEWKNFIIGDYAARAFQWRILITAANKNLCVIVRKLSVEVDMPDRVWSIEDALCPSTGLAVSFGQSFKEIPAVATNAQGMEQGDYYEITNKTRDGFTIQFKNSAGVGVARTFDAIARSYGYAA